MWGRCGFCRSKTHKRADCPLERSMGNMDAAEEEERYRRVYNAADRSRARAQRRRNWGFRR